MRSPRFLIWIAVWGATLAMELVASGGPRLNYHALVIGINEYEHWSDLRRARKDAESVAEVLRRQYRFETVRCLLDESATAQSIESNLRDLAASLGESDALLLYFAGHGYYDTVLDQGFWIPGEARLAVEGRPAVSDWIDNDRIRHYLGRTRARHVLVVSDACFSGSLFRGNFLNLEAPTHTWYQRAIARPSRWAITSGDMELVPDAGVFGVKFLQFLKYPLQEVFSVSDLASWLKQEVSDFDGTLPLAGPLHDPSHQSGGEFVFVPNGSESEFWQRLPTAQTLQSQEVGPAQLHAFANLDSQLLVNGQWVGQVQAGQTVVFPLPAEGKHWIEFRAEGEVYERMVQVRSGQAVHVNAIFAPQSSDALFWELGSTSGEFFLSMDDEFLLDHVGRAGTEGGRITRDSIRGNGLRFHQRARLVLDGRSPESVGASEFTVGLWFYWIGDAQDAALVFQKHDGRAGFRLRVRGGHLVFEAGNPEGGVLVLESSQAIRPEQWLQVSIRRSIDRVELWLNGEVDASIQVDAAGDWSSEAPWVFAFDEESELASFDGVMDEFRVATGPVAEAWMRSAYRLKFERFRLTHRAYGDRDDLETIVHKLYGASARIADWSHLRSRFGDDLPQLLDYLGVKAGDRFWVTHQDRRFFATARHFFAEATPDAEGLDIPPVDWIEGEPSDLALSAWSRLNLPILVIR